MSFAVVTEMLVRSLEPVSSEEKVPLIEKAHVVESVIDIIKLKGCLSVDIKQKLNDTHGTDCFFTLSNHHHHRDKLNSH